MPCILLHRVVPGGELKDCAQGTIVQPMSRDMHHSKMDEDVMRVRLVTIVPEIRDVEPPIQPLEPTRITWSLKIASSGR